MTSIWLWLAIAYGLFHAVTLPFFYGRRLNACFHLEVIQFLTCWFWPLFAVDRFGPVDNNNGHAVEPRLPWLLAWLDTPDNSLLGDFNHRIRHAGSPRYWQMTCWLARNRAYGFKWGPLAAPMTTRIIDGDIKINCNTATFGTLRISMGRFWQWKRVKQIRKTGYCWMPNFGWLLDDASQDKALFLFSPRIARVKKEGANQ